MIRVMRNRAAVAASLLMSVCMMAGCAGNGGKTAGQTTAAETTPAETTQAVTTTEAKETSAETAAETAGKKKYKLPEKVTIGALGTHAPYNFMEGDELVGYEVDIWKEIAKRNGFELDYTTAALGGLFGMLDTKKIDTIFSQISITDERKEKYDFTSPYMYNPGGWLIRKDSEDIETIEDLYGKSAAVVPGSVDIQMYENAAPNGEIEIVIFQEYPASIKAVETGRIFATGTAIPKGKYMLKTEPDLNLKVSGYNGITQTNAFPMYRDRDDDLLEAASKTIDDMREEGLLRELSMKWFDMDTTVKDQEY